MTTIEAFGGRANVRPFEYPIGWEPQGGWSRDYVTNSLLRRLADS
jgi:hypothetical protein